VLEITKDTIVLHYQQLLIMRGQPTAPQLVDEPATLCQALMNYRQVFCRALRRNLSTEPPLSENAGKALHVNGLTK
jgi:hypothetical protein